MFLWVEPNFLNDNEVQPSLHLNCHYQIVFSKLNFKIEYPLLYEQLVWDKKKMQILNQSIK